MIKLRYIVELNAITDKQKEEKTRKCKRVQPSLQGLICSSHVAKH